MLEAVEQMDDANTRIASTIGIGFLCRQWNCHNFVKVQSSNESDTVWDGIDSVEYHTKKCTKCLDYRRNPLRRALYECDVAYVGPKITAR